MQTQLRDVRFQLDKSRGWPKIHDDGLADLRIAGRGMSIVMNLASASTEEGGEQRRGFFGKGKTSTKKARYALEPQFVRVKIDRLYLNMHDTRRDWVYRLASPFIAARVKRAIERSIRDQIVSSIRTLDSLTRGLSSSLFAQ